jgi:hypothetical protein
MTEVLSSNMFLTARQLLAAFREHSYVTCTLTSGEIKVGYVVHINSIDRHFWLMADPKLARDYFSAALRERERDAAKYQKFSTVLEFSTVVSVEKTDPPER